MRVRVDVQRTPYVLVAHVFVDRHFFFYPTRLGSFSVAYGTVADLAAAAERDSFVGLVAFG